MKSIWPSAHSCGRQNVIDTWLQFDSKRSLILAYVFNIFRADALGVCVGNGKISSTDCHSAIELTTNLTTFDERCRGCAVPTRVYTGTRVKRWLSHASLLCVLPSRRMTQRMITRVQSMSPLALGPRRTSAANSKKLELCASGMLELDVRFPLFLCTNACFATTYAPLNIPVC